MDKKRRYGDCAVRAGSAIPRTGIVSFPGKDSDGRDFIIVTAAVDCQAFFARAYRPNTKM